MVLAHAARTNARGMTVRLAVVVLVVILAGVGFAEGGTGSAITQPIIDAIEGAGDGILGPIGVLLGVLVTVGIGFAIVKTIRG